MAGWNGMVSSAQQSPILNQWASRYASLFFVFVFFQFVYIKHSFKFIYYRSEKTEYLHLSLKLICVSGNGLHFLNERN